MRMAAAALVPVLLGVSAAGQEHKHQAPSSHAPSASSVERSTTSERVAGLSAGRGMGLADAAERNGYPGPRHVLELARELKLTAAQRAATESTFEAMRREAVVLGEQLLRDEAELDALFRHRRATPMLVDQASRRVGASEAELKSVHLNAHLRMMTVLTAQQISAYAALRGRVARIGGRPPTG
jgi:Spy/CpxP family protein refolding chaperone